MHSRRSRSACSEDEQQRLHLLATLQRLLARIDRLVVQTRGRSRVSARLLEALRRTNQERIALERELWLLEDRILRDILCAPPAEAGSGAFDAARGAGVAQALAATAAGRAGYEALGKGC